MRSENRLIPGKDGFSLLFEHMTLTLAGIQPRPRCCGSGLYTVAGLRLMCVFVQRCVIQVRTSDRSVKQKFRQYVMQFSNLRTKPSCMSSRTLNALASAVTVFLCASIAGKYIERQSAPRASTQKRRVLKLKFLRWYHEQVEVCIPASL